MPENSPIFLPRSVFPKDTPERMNSLSYGFKLPGGEFVEKFPDPDRVILDGLTSLFSSSAPQSYTALGWGGGGEGNPLYRLNEQAMQLLGRPVAKVVGDKGANRKVGLLPDADALLLGVESGVSATTTATALVPKIGFAEITERQASELERLYGLYQWRVKDRDRVTSRVEKDMTPQNGVAAYLLLRYVSSRRHGLEKTTTEICEEISNRRLAMYQDAIPEQKDIQRLHRAIAKAATFAGYLHINCAKNTLHLNEKIFENMVLEQVLAFPNQ
jgi:hypothetical protein